MATERIDIIVAQRGARVVRRDLEGIGRGAQRAQGTVRKLTLALQTLALGGGAAVFTNLLDTFTLMQNRLRNVTDTTSQLNAVTSELFRVANSTRSSFEATSTVYARTALAVKDLGRSQREVLDFTESLNQAVILSGVGAAEATGALIQLSQGMASNTLRGDELRSVLEQLAAVADVIADKLGVTRGELREMGFEGKITTQIILDAFKDAREELSERFAKTVPTIGQSFTVLRNKVIQWIGEMNKATGLLQILSRAVLFLGNNIDTIARILGALALLMGGRLAIRGIGAVIGAFKVLFTLLKNGRVFAALGPIVAGLGALFVTFADKIEIGGEHGATAMDLLAVAMTRLGAVAETVWAKVLTGLELIDIKIERVTFTDILIKSAKDADAILRLMKGLGAAVTQLALNITAGILRLIQGSTEGLKNMIRETGESLNSGLKKLGVNEKFVDSILPKKTEDDLKDKGEKAGKGVIEAFIEGMKRAEQVSPIEDFMKGLLGDADKRAKERRARLLKEAEEFKQALLDLLNKGVDKTAGKINKDFAEAIRLLEEEAKLLKLNNTEREVQARLLDTVNNLKGKGFDLDKAGNQDQRKQLENLIRGNQALQDQADLLEEILGPMEIYIRKIAALNALLEAGAINQEQFNRKFAEIRVELLETQNTAVAGLEQALLKIHLQASDLGQLTADSVNAVFDNLGDAFTEFVMTGRLDFKSLANSIVADLTRIAIQATIIRSLSGIGLGLTGTPVPGFASGGSFVVGGSGGTDSQLVAFRATPGEDVNVRTPQQRREDTEGGGKTLQFNQTIQIMNPTDVDGFKRAQPAIAAQGLSFAQSVQRRIGR